MKHNSGAEATAGATPVTVQSRAMQQYLAYFVGLGYGHHATHSGYEGFVPYVGKPLKPPVRKRWLKGALGWPVNALARTLTRHPWYSPGAHITEWDAWSHMRRHERLVYHVLYGDSDLWLLRRTHRKTRNYLVATFHQPAESLRKIGVIERIASDLDAAVLMCEAQRPFFESFLPAERIHVVRHGVDSQYFRPDGRSAGEPVCITVGSHLRDFATLKAAIPLVWNERPEVRFVVAGTKVSKELNPQSLSDDRVRFHDKLDDDQLLEAYRSATLAVFSFEDATANNAVLESMATGLPIVSTDVGGIGEYIQDAGALCAPRDPRALADGILSIVGDPRRASDLGARARSRAEDHDFRLVAERMWKIYAGILGVDPSGSG